MAFTEREKARIRHHLGYPSWSSLSNGIQLGFPAGGHPLFLVEQAFHRLLPDGEAAVRADLCECEATEEQIGEARKRLRASKLDDVELNAREPAALRAELVYWQDKLADDLGVMRNPAAQSTQGGLPGGINARVLGS